LCGEAGHDEFDCPDDDSDLPDGDDGVRALRRIDDELIRLGAPPRERRPHGWLS
jgi:hypothetical protein